MRKDLFLYVNTQGWDEHLPAGHFADADGKLIKAVCHHNAKGSVDGAMAVKYLHHLKQCFPGISPTNQAVLIFDGCPTHITAEFLNAAKSIGFSCQLRPPNTTSKTQGEDVANFGPFKTAFDLSKRLHSFEKQQRLVSVG